MGGKIKKPVLSDGAIHILSLIYPPPALRYRGAGSPRRGVEEKAPLPTGEGFACLPVGRG